MSDFKGIRTGVIGVGSMGQNHARIYSEISDFVAISDPDQIQGLKIAEKFGVEWFENYEDMLNAVDAVSISVPTFLHKTIAENVAKAGVHMLVEKPLAISEMEASDIIKASKKYNVVLAVGHVERHNPVVTSLKSFLNDNACGQILSLSARRFSNYPHRITDVGVLFDLTIHDVDVINNIVNCNPISVYASGGKSMNNSYEDFVCLVINYENGIVGICQTNWLTPMKVRDLSITTTKNFISMDFLNKNVNVMNSEYGNIDQSNLYDTEINFKSKALQVNEIEPLKSELNDFLMSIRMKAKPLVSGEDGLKAVSIVQAGLKSIQDGKLIKL